MSLSEQFFKAPELTCKERTSFSWAYFSSGSCIKVDRFSESEVCFFLPPREEGTEKKGLYNFYMIPKGSKKA